MNEKPNSRKRRKCRILVVVVGGGGGGEGRGERLTFRSAGQVKVICAHPYTLVISLVSLTS